MNKDRHEMYAWMTSAQRTLTFIGQERYASISSQEA